MQQHLTVDFEDLDLVVECGGCNTEIILTNAPELDEPFGFIDRTGSHIRCPQCDGVMIEFDDPVREAFTSYRTLMNAAVQLKEAPAETGSNEDLVGASIRLRFPYPK